MRRGIWSAGMLLALCWPAGGCGQMFLDRAVLFADTYTEDGSGFSEKSPQWAYEGETVTFDFAPDPDVTDYAVFTLPNGTQEYIDRRTALDTDGFYRVTGRFVAGRESRQYTVSAKAYTVRRQRDWYYDRESKKWVLHVTQSDQADSQVGSASLKVICYRSQVEMTFAPGSRRTQDAVLVLLRSDGTRTERRVKVDGGQPGFDLIGPDAKGTYTVRYVPTWDEVNRTGKTDVELHLSYADGARDVIRTTIDTP